ncbi:RHS repeat-associated core domain-containing protein [Edaphobacter aggregans]|uniref:RHS repeat-associated core domain-containing protein n=1 Tax=Edaphobacter aggregans TaxID=570835 RepID=UPI001FDEDFEB|nr:RHS repeat-associated core domain-containing protein [Edaphobacter aggregans]
MHSCGLRSSRFTGKERDTESGLDYFGARYFASTSGRFMSPDWCRFSFTSRKAPFCRRLLPLTRRNPDP